MWIGARVQNIERTAANNRIIIKYIPFRILYTCTLRYTCGHVLGRTWRHTAVRAGVNFNKFIDVAAHSPTRLNDASASIAYTVWFSVGSGRTVYTYIYYAFSARRFLAAFQANVIAAEDARLARVYWLYRSSIVTFFVTVIIIIKRVLLFCRWNFFVAFR